MARITITDVEGPVVVRAAGAILGETRVAKRLEEEGYEPVLYIPRGDIGMEFLDRSDTRTTCPHKGEASYFHIAAQPGDLSGVIRDAAWSYEEPLDAVAEIAGHLAFDPEKAQVERL